MLGQQDWQELLIKDSAVVREVVENLNLTRRRIAIVVDSHRRIMGTITDGDIRRGLLRGCSLDSKALEIANLNPYIARQGDDFSTLRTSMINQDISLVPIVDSRDVVVEVMSVDDMPHSTIRDNPFVIMVGGRGRRLLPLTNSVPKPMLQIQGRPLLEHVIERAKNQGFSRFVLAINYLGDIIQNHFGDGTNLGIEIKYLHENRPLGTAGALSLWNDRPTIPFVVTNGDVLTDIDYGELVNFHSEHSAVATMAVRLYELQHQFGVVELDGTQILGIVEKPTIRSFINAGIYVLDPFALSFLKEDTECDMPTLFDELRLQGCKTVAFPMHEKWIDVGRPSDLETANQPHSE